MRVGVDGSLTGSFFVFLVTSLFVQLLRIMIDILSQISDVFSVM